MASPTDPSFKPFAYLGMLFNSDGSITRKDGFLSGPGTSDPTLPSPVLTKDVPINQSSKTWLRIYVSREALDSSSFDAKLPLIVYYHGGGFIVGSADSPVYHNFCALMAVEVPAVVVSVEYRLAPEHRLPTAYQDSVEALHWIKTSDEEWLARYADFSECYIMGASAGGNIAYHVAAFLGNDVDLGPLKIRGLMLHQTFFGGTMRTQSEQTHANDKVIPLRVTDIMWELSLPSGVDRDHEYSNLTVGGGSHVCDKIKKLGWKVLVTGCEGDPLYDSQIELLKIMKEKEVEVVSKFDEGDCHGIELFDLPKAKALRAVVKDFVSRSSN